MPWLFRVVQLWAVVFSGSRKTWSPKSRQETQETQEATEFKNGKWEGLGGFGAVEVDPPVEDRQDRLRNYRPWNYASSAYAVCRIVAAMTRGQGGVIGIARCPIHAKCRVLSAICPVLPGLRCEKTSVTLLAQ